MSDMPLKQKALVSWAVVAILYAVAVVLGFTSQSDAWTKAKRTYARSVTEYRNARALIRQIPALETELEAERSAIAGLNAQAQSDTFAMLEIDRVCTNNFIRVDSRTPGKETVAGELHRTPVVVNRWKGSFRNLVKFLYDLDNSDTGMFDVSMISIHPEKKDNAYTGYLTGGFTVNCVYTRQDDTEKGKR